jgi:peptidoglycan/xylan/chitin deacetylase (PgdA/CDA1 family)
MDEELFARDEDPHDLPSPVEGVRGTAPENAADVAHMPDSGEAAEAFAEAQTVPLPASATAQPDKPSTLVGRARAIALAISNAWRDAPVPRKRTWLAALTLALLVAVVASTTLATLAFGEGGIPPFSLFAPHAAVTATTGGGAPSPDATDSLPAGESPQGCVNGVAPLAAQGPYGPIFSTHGYASVHNEVALTFDDGPNPTFTPQILAELEAANVPATFFVVGRHAQMYPDLVRAEWQDGDPIGNHTFGHEWIPGLAPDNLLANLEQTTQTIRQATGDQCVWLFRAPFGDYLPAVHVGPTATPSHGTPASGTPTPRPTTPVQVPITVTRAWTTVHEAGYTAFNWDVDGKDWLRPGTQLIEQRIIAQLHPGAIILMHDGAPDNEKQDRSQTVAALPAILAAIKARGLRPVTLPQMLADAGMLKYPALPTPTPTATATDLQGGLPQPLGAAALIVTPTLARRSRRRNRRAR